MLCSYDRTLKGFCLCTGFFSRSEGCSPVSFYLIRHHNHCLNQTQKDYQQTLVFSKNLQNHHINLHIIWLFLFYSFCTIAHNNHLLLISLITEYPNVKFIFLIAFTFIVIYFIPYCS